MVFSTTYILFEIGNLWISLIISFVLISDQFVCKIRKNHQFLSLTLNASGPPTMPRNIRIITLLLYPLWW